MTSYVYVPFKAHSHYCVFRVRLQQTVALLRRDRKIPISALTQSTAESADRCGECEWAFTLLRRAFAPAQSHDRDRGLALALGHSVLDEVEHVLVVEESKG